MAAKGTIGAKIVLEGEKEYRNAIKEINTQQKELRSEMKLCQTQFKSQENSLAALTKKQEVLTKQYDTQKQKVETYKTALKAASEAEQNASKKVNDLQTAYDKAKSKMEEMAKATDTTEEEMKQQGEEVEKLARQLASAQGDYSKMSEKVMQYQTSLNNAEADLTEMDNELKKNTKYLDEAENSSDGLAKSIDEFGDEVEETKEEVSTFGSVLKANLTSDLIVAGIKSIVSGVKEIASACIETGMEFEASMSNVAALSGSTGAELEALSQKAKDMGASTMFSASQAADALSYMALAGWNDKQMLEGIEPILNLAAAANMDLAQASDIVTDYLTAFGLSAQDAAKFSDQMAYAMANSNTTVELLGESYKNCAATASSLNYSVEDVTAVLMTMANAGVKGGEAGTALSSIMTRLATNTSECNDKLAAYGVEVYDAEGNMNSLSDILEGLEHVWADLTDQEQASLAKSIAGVSHYSKLQTIMKGVSEQAQEGGQSFYDYSAALEECDGAAVQMANTMQDNLKGKLTIFQSALDAVKESTYELFDDALKEGVESATESMTLLNRSINSGDLQVSLKKVSDSIGNLMEKIALGAQDALPKLIDGLADIIDNADKIVPAIKGIIAAFLTFKTVTTSVALVTSAMKLYQAATEGATIAQWAMNVAVDANPYILLASVLAGVAVAVGTWAYANKDALTGMSELDQQTKRLIESSQNLNTALNSSSEKRAEDRAEMETQGQVASDLVKHLENMQKAYSQGANNMDQMKMAVDELNAIFPDLGLEIDENTGQLNQNTDALKQNVDAMMKQAKLAAAQSDLEQIAKDQYDAEKKLRDLEKQRAEQSDELNEAQKRLNETSADGTVIFETNGQALSDAEIAVGNAKTGYDELNNQISETQQQISDLTNEYTEVNDYINANTEVVEENTEAIEETSVALSDLQDAYNEAYTAAYESITQQVGLFTDLSGQAKISVSDITGAFESQTEVLTTYANNLAIASKYASDSGNTDYASLLSSIEALGVDGSGYLQTLVDATQSSSDDLTDILTSYAEAQEAKTTLAETMAEFETTMSTGLDDTNTEAEDGMKDVNESLSEGWDEAEKRVDDAGTAMEDSTQKSMDGMVQVMDKTTGTVVATASNMATSIISAVEGKLSFSTFQSIGSNVASGLAQGMRDNLKDVEAAAKDLATAAEKASKAKLEVNSPSKVFKRLGMSVAEGFDLGIRTGFDEISGDVSKAMGTVIADANGVASVGTSTPVTSGSTSILSLLSEYLPEIAANSQDVNVTLEGDANKLFNVVRKQSQVFQRTTGTSAFA